MSWTKPASSLARASRIAPRNEPTNVVLVAINELIGLAANVAANAIAVASTSLGSQTRNATPIANASAAVIHSELINIHAAF